jgi:hypothetical protein
MRPLNFDKQVPLRIDKKTYAVLRRMQNGRRATIAALIRGALESALATPESRRMSAQMAQSLVPRFTFSTMFMMSSDQLTEIEREAEEVGVSRNSYIVAAIRLYVERQRQAA